MTSKTDAQAFWLLERGGVLDVIRTVVGRAEVVGSVDLDLVVWPDIDLYTRLPPDDGHRLLALLPLLHERLAQLRYTLVRANFNNEYRRPGNPYGQGLYCGLKVLTDTGDRVWKIDLWAWDSATFDQKLGEHRQLARSLSEADRDLILQIKDAVHLRPEYRDTLSSMDVYAFAIQRRGRTVREFDEFIAHQISGAERDTTGGLTEAH